MSLIIKDDPSDYSLCPEGMHEGVIVDAVNLGTIETPWGDKDKVSLVVETQSVDEHGKPYILAKRFNKSLHEKASLRQALERLRGKKLTLNELKEGVDLEAYIGRPCMILVDQNETPERIYANIDLIMPYAGKKVIKPSGDYTRMINREDYKKPEEYAQAVNGVS